MLKILIDFEVDRRFNKGVCVSQPSALVLAPGTQFLFTSSDPQFFQVGTSVSCKSSASYRSLVLVIAH